MGKISQLEKFHRSKAGLAIFGVVELALAYGFFGLSVDRGNFFWYLLTLLFLIGGLQNIFKLIREFFKKQT